MEYLNRIEDDHLEDQQAYVNPLNDFKLVEDIEKYIQDELNDSKYYEVLAKDAPNKKSKELILEFSEDENRHAEQLMKVYYELTGNRYEPLKIKDPEITKYKKELKNRILEETTAYKKYGEKYLIVCRPYLKKVFFLIRSDEAKHAMRIPILLAE